MWSSSATRSQVVVHVLQGFALQVPMRGMVELKNRKACAVIAYLALQPDASASRESLSALCWGERTGELARASLRQVLRQLRATFQACSVPVLSINRDRVALASDSVVTDLDLLFGRLSDGVIDPALYQGEYDPERILHGFEDLDSGIAAWLRAARTHWRERVVDALQAILGAQTTPGPDRHRAALALLQLDPVHEGAHRHLIRSAVEHGNLASALRQYEELWTRLAEDYDAEPSAETQALIVAVKCGTATPLAGQDPPQLPDPMRPEVIVSCRLDGVGRAPEIPAVQAAASELIGGHRGRAVGTGVRSLTLAFAAPVDAVSFAIDFQNWQRNRWPSDGGKSALAARIGIRLAAPYEREPGVAGDDYVASRLADLADPGGVCISGQVFAQVRHKLDLICVDLGPRQLAGSDGPERVYAVDLAPSAAGGASPPANCAPDTRSIVRAYRRSVAVMPFHNVSGDPAQDHFSDGIAEGIINALSQSRWFCVTPRSTSFSYRTVMLSAEALCARLGVRYLLEGSVQRDGDRARIGVQLADGINGQLVWSRRYDAAMVDLLAVEDDVTRQVAGSLEHDLLTAAAGRASRRAPRNADAFDRVLRAYHAIWRLSPGDCVRARHELALALQHDAGFPQAHTLLAGVAALEVYMGWTSDPQRALADGELHGRKAVLLDGSDAWAHYALGIVYLLSRQLDRAIGELEKAVALNQSFAMAYGALGQARAFSGEPEKAQTSLRLAMRLSPRDPMLAYWQVAMAVVCFGGEDYAAGLDWARRAVYERPEWPGGHRLSAICAAFLGKMRLAAQSLTRMRELQPGYTIDDLDDLLPFRDRRYIDRYVEGLRRAGWPE